jgi:hypothetical protein
VSTVEKLSRPIGIIRAQDGKDFCRRLGVSRVRFGIIKLRRITPLMMKRVLDGALAPVISDIILLDC